MSEVTSLGDVVPLIVKELLRSHLLTPYGLFLGKTLPAESAILDACCDFGSREDVMWDMAQVQFVFCLLR